MSPLLLVAVLSVLTLSLGSATDDADSSWSSDLVQGEEQISLVLPLTLRDAGRALLLLETLQHWVDPSSVRTLFIVVPVVEENAYTWLEREATPFAVEVVPEDSLFSVDPATRPSWLGYAVQMAVKLLVSRLVPTRFYLTLDADCLAVRPLHAADLVGQDGRASFNIDLPSAHPSWWESSLKLLGITTSGNPGDGVPIGIAEGHAPLLGVTPNVLSVEVAKRTIKAVRTPVVGCPAESMLSRE